MKAFGYGDVLITLGTGKIAESESRATGLTSEHDYAVIHLEERGGKYMFLIKNPWSEGGGWTAAGESSQDHGIAKLTEQLDISPSGSGDHTRIERPKLEPGSFWMDLNDIFQHFESLYLNWNPGLFSHREDVHFAWNLHNTNRLWASFGRHPQYRVQSDAGGTLWLVLSRHFQSSHPSDSCVVGNLETINAEDAGFISLYVFENGGGKVFLADGSLIRGPYVDSPNTLIKVESKKGVPYTVVVSEQELLRMEHTFTLSVFSLGPLSISQASDRYRNHMVLEGAWTPATAGGNASSPAYCENPQFSVNLSGSSDVSMLLEAQSGDFPVHVKLLWANGNPVRNVTCRDIVGDSGEYRKGHAYAEVAGVAAGRYTIICSTFEPGQLCEFTLQVGTMSDCVVERMSAKPGGRFTNRFPIAFFGTEDDRLWAPLSCSRLTRLSILAQSYKGDGIASTRNSSNNIPLKLALEHGKGLGRHVLAVSGDDDFCNAHYGARINDVDIHPAMCAGAGLWVLLERGGPLDSHTQEGIIVEVYSDARVEVAGIFARRQGEVLEETEDLMNLMGSCGDATRSL
ncbi:MAG: hypothetical protein Q9174_000408 [Haloplaca sp. 1 TL-2023]